MEKKLKALLQYCEEKSAEKMTEEQKNIYRTELLTQIQFFQHERFVHLIVTVLFALLTVMTLLANLFLNQPLLFALTGLLLILLVPYIRHYYILENGVQKLYEYYSQIPSK